MADTPQREKKEKKKRGVVWGMGMVTTLLTPHLGQVGGLANSIDTTKCDDKGPSLALRLHDISQNIHPSFGLQDLHQ